MTKLTIAEGGAQTVYEIFDDQNEVTIGRGAANAVQIRDGHASKHHASLYRVQGRWKLIDLESKNGTRVNGQFRNQHWLDDGDVMAIGVAEMRYSGETVAAPPPPAPAAAPAPRTFAEEPILATPPPPPAPAPAPAPAYTAAAPTSAPAPSRSAPSRGSARRARRDDYDDYDDRDGEERQPRRRGDSNSAVIVLLGGLGAIAFIGLMFMLFSTSGSINNETRAHASALADGGKLEQAIKYAERHGDPSAPHWDSLKEELDAWKRELALRPVVARNAEGRNWFDTNILRRTRTSMWRAKDALSRSEAVEVLREFLSLYSDTSRARELLFSKTAPYPEYREWMKEYPTETEKPGAVFSRLTSDVDVMVNRERFGDAIRKLEFEMERQQLTMTRENAQEFVRMARGRVEDIRLQARRDFDSALAEVDGLVRRGEKRRALRRLQAIIDTYGLPKLTKEAQIKFDEVR